MTKKGYVRKTVRGNEWAVWMKRSGGNYHPVDVWSTRKGAEKQLKKLMK